MMESLEVLSSRSHLCMAASCCLSTTMKRAPCPSLDCYWRESDPEVTSLLESQLSPGRLCSEGNETTQLQGADGEWKDPFPDALLILCPVTLPQFLF